MGTVGSILLRKATILSPPISVTDVFSIPSQLLIKWRVFKKIPINKKYQCLSNTNNNNIRCLLRYVLCAKHIVSFIFNPKRTGIIPDPHLCTQHTIWHTVALNTGGTYDWIKEQSDRQLSKPALLSAFPGEEGSWIAPWSPDSKPEPSAPSRFLPRQKVTSELKPWRTFSGPPVCCNTFHNNIFVHCTAFLCCWSLWREKYFHLLKSPNRLGM